ncbi:hypothetical protein ABZ733_13220 [Streptomyces longwoodensis]|uniref:hypothetical protein n=1 Tax=Streptomyces longwoodensis TaxID=68231 RepID=UPI0033E2AB1B
MTEKGTPVSFAVLAVQSWLWFGARDPSFAVCMDVLDGALLAAVQDRSEVVAGPNEMES